MCPRASIYIAKHFIGKRLQSCIGQRAAGGEFIDTQVGKLFVPEIVKPLCRDY